MKLPNNLDLRERFKYKLHHINKTIDCVSFTNGQQSVLLTAFETATKNDHHELTPESAIAIRDAFVNLCNTCITTPNVDVSTWPDYEIDALFLKLRVKSLDSKADRILVCKNIVNDEYCNTRIKISFELDKVTIINDDRINPKIDLGSGYTLLLREPKIYTVNINQLDDNTDSMALLLDKLIYMDKDSDVEMVYSFDEQTADDIEQFIEHTITPRIKMQIINQFLSKLPHIHLETTAICPTCSHQHVLTANSLKDVFN
jgi:hypothetical protein